MLVTYDEPPYCIKVKGLRVGGQAGSGSKSTGAAYPPAPARGGPASPGWAGGGGAQRAGGVVPSAASE